MSRFLAVFLVVTYLYGTTRDLVVFDTDSGLFGDDGAALVMLLRGTSPVVVQGITIVPGNVWAPQGAEYMFHILDLLKKPQMQVAMGADGPLIHTAAMSKEFDRRWGGLGYTGAFAQDPAAVIPAPGSKISTRKLRRDAINFLISEIERHPGEVTILALGPMTNIALALRLKPDIETKIKRIVFMGGNIRVAGNASNAAEFNFWFDPEATRKVLRAHWPRIDVTTVDVSIKAKLTGEMLDAISHASTPAAQYISTFEKELGYMWDEIAACAWLDPAIITRTRDLYMDIDVSHGPSYGHTLTWDKALKPALDVQLVHAQVDLDVARFSKMFVDLMSAR